MLHIIASLIVLWIVFTLFNQLFSVPFIMKELSRTRFFRICFYQEPHRCGYMMGINTEEMDGGLGRSILFVKFLYWEVELQLMLGDYEVRSIREQLDMLSQEEFDSLKNK